MRNKLLAQDNATGPRRLRLELQKVVLLKDESAVCNQLLSLE